MNVHSLSTWAAVLAAAAAFPSQARAESGGVAAPSNSISVCEYDALEKAARPRSMFAYEYCYGKLRERALEAGAWKDQMEPTLRDRIAKTCPVTKTDVWNGGRRTVFKFRGHEAWVVEPPPEAKALPSRRWTWTMQWASAFVPRTSVPRLLKSGWHHVTLMQYDERMTEEGIALSEAFQDFLVKELGFDPKANLIGMSWGGFFSVRYAAARPERVDRIYLDAPLLSFEGFKHDLGPWKGTEPAGGWRDDPRMPVNMAGALAESGIPILLLYGKADTVVPPALNCERFAAAYKAAGGKNMKSTARGNFAHHPHGCDVGDGTIYCFFHFKR